MENNKYQEIEEFIQNFKYPYEFKHSPRVREVYKPVDIEIQPPPSIGGKPDIQWSSVLIMPLLTLIIMFAASYFAFGSMTMIYLSAPMTLVSIGMGIWRYHAEKKKYKRNQQLQIDKYNEYIKKKEIEIKEEVSKQRKSIELDFPSVKECFDLAKEFDRTLWKKRITDDDFMHFRLGTGITSAKFSIKAERETLKLVDDELEQVGLGLKKKYSVLDNYPMCINLKDKAGCGLVGDRDMAIGLAKNMIVQAATYSDYEELKIVVICDDDEYDEFEFARWLPHCYNNVEDRTVRLIAMDRKSVVATLDYVDDILDERLTDKKEEKYLFDVVNKNEPHFLFVCASTKLMNNHPVVGKLLKCNKSLGMSCLFLFDDIKNLPTDCDYIIELGENSYFYEKNDASNKSSLTIEEYSDAEYELFGRYMAPNRIRTRNKNAVIPSNISFLQGYKAQTPDKLNIAERWKDAVPEDTMGVPIGIDETGEAFVFDINEKSMGPHGIVAGMTGSGKSEMVQSWILSMAVNFSPYDVSFVLVDFKGTGLLLPFMKLPHVVGTISNLDKNIDRNLVSLNSELKRRQALLDKYGVKNIKEYRKLCKTNKDMEKLSYLFVVIDEFAEFKIQYPDFMTVISSIFGIGRTLGIHMLLLTQKPTSAIDDKMAANTRFRWCLKVATSADSKDMLGRDNAAKIKHKGRAYVRIGEDEIFKEVQPFFSGATYNPNLSLQIQRDNNVYILDNQGNKCTVKTDEDNKTEVKSDKDEIDVIVEYIADMWKSGGEKFVRKVWVDKLSNVYDTSFITTKRYSEETGKYLGGLHVTSTVHLGVSDIPIKQSLYKEVRDMLKYGNVVVYGGAGSGKTTTLQSIIMSNAEFYSPDALHMYVIDMAGGVLKLFNGLPHVGGVITTDNISDIANLSRVIDREIEIKQKLFSKLGVNNIADFVKTTRKPLYFTHVIIDNIAGLMELYPDADMLIQKILREGIACGINLIITANTETDVPFRLRQLFGYKLVLNMTDRGDYSSIFGRRTPIPENIPGRGLIHEKFDDVDQICEIQVVKYLSQEKDELKRINKMKEVINKLNKAWDGNRAMKVTIDAERDLSIKNNLVKNKLFMGVDAETMNKQYINLLTNQYLMCSYTEKETSFKNLLIDQLKNGENFDKIIVFDEDAEKFDNEIKNLMPIMQERLNNYDGNKLDIEKYPNILVLLDNYTHCFECMSNETEENIEAIIRLGKGLNVVVVIIDKNDKLSQQFLAGDRILAEMKDLGLGIIKGGKMLDHGVWANTNAGFDIDSQSVIIAINDKITKLTAYRGW